jgi:hypothetical protein
MNSILTCWVVMLTIAKYLYRMIRCIFCGSWLLCNVHKDTFPDEYRFVVTHAIAHTIMLRVNMLYIRTCPRVRMVITMPICNIAYYVLCTHERIRVYTLMLYRDACKRVHLSHGLHMWGTNNNPRIITY